MLKGLKTASSIALCVRQVLDFLRPYMPYLQRPNHVEDGLSADLQPFADKGSHLEDDQRLW